MILMLLEMLLQENILHFPLVHGCIFIFINIPNIFFPYMFIRV